MKQQYGERVTCKWNKSILNCTEGDRKQYEHLKSEVARLEKMLREKQIRDKEESKSADSGVSNEADDRSVGSEHLTDEDVTNFWSS